jgi:hypothetical protein
MSPLTFTTLLLSWKQRAEERLLGIESCCGKGVFETKGLKERLKYSNLTRGADEVPGLRARQKKCRNARVGLDSKEKVK